MTITATKDPGTYTASSRSRKGLDHTVDAIHLTCTCESFMEFATRDERNPCAHLEAVLAHHAAIIGITSHPDVIWALARLGEARATLKELPVSCHYKAELKKRRKEFSDTIRKVIGKPQPRPKESPFAWHRCRQG